MKNLKYLIVTKNKTYKCSFEEMQRKVEALETFKIEYKVYYQIQNSWEKLQISVKDFVCNS